MDVVLSSPNAIPGIGDALRHTVSPPLAQLMLPGGIRAMLSPAPVPEPFNRLFPKELMVRPIQLRASAEDAALMTPSVMDLEQHYRELKLPVVILTGGDDHLARVLGCAVVNAGDHPVLARFGQDQVDRFHDGLLLPIEPRRAPERQREIGRADVDGVQALNREDLIQVVESLTGLDHGECNHSRLGVLRVVWPGVQECTDRPEAAAALGG
jgi:hypothetical protein